MIIGPDSNVTSHRSRTVVARKPPTRGLPADFVSRHKPDASGAVTLTIDYPDSLPVFSFARSEDLRKRMYMEYNNRGYPKNIEVLDKMIARRAELARLIGFSSWADYITADKMVENAKSASAFIDASPRLRVEAEREYAVLLKRKRRTCPRQPSSTPGSAPITPLGARRASTSILSRSAYFEYDR